MEKTTEDRIEQMEELAGMVNGWLVDVRSLGNETAYSDSYIDKIYSKAKEIKEQLEDELDELMSKDRG